MLKIFWQMCVSVFKILGFVAVPLILAYLVFLALCAGWFVYYKYVKKYPVPVSTKCAIKKINLLYQIFVLVPQRYVLDFYSRESDYFDPKGIHMFCGEQGSGKTIACVEMMLRLRYQYPASRLITNFGVVGEDDPLSSWKDLLEYNNGHQGVIVGIDEIQNWFMSGKNQLPEGMLEIVTQNRKNCRILCCTAQVFTRVNKAIREQVNMVYQPHTFLGCFTIVMRKKPVFDSEGNCTELKSRGFYSFVHTPELRSAYDTYKVIHTLSSEGFKELPSAGNNSTTFNVVLSDSKKRR